MHDANGEAMLHHDHGAHEMPPPSHGSGAAGMSMQSTVDIADPMSREGSGTSWLPDSTPMYGKMFMFGGDMLMLHGAIFPRYTNVSTRRGDDRIDAPNWIMAMYSHPFGRSAQIGARLMMSLDPLTEDGRGYPLLFQTGESWHDQPLHDRQHPHDLFDELSISFSQKFDHDLSAYLYFGYPGEPALGPPTFMHRPSAMDDPDAPIGHHWQDSTHVTFGNWSNSLVWGQNNDTGEGKTESFLVESDYQCGRNTVYIRWERVEKSGHELVLNPAADTRIFPVSAYTIGCVRDLSHGNGLDIGLGTQFTINGRPDTLDHYYGDGTGYAFEFFLRIRPSLHGHGAHEHSEHFAGMEK